MKAGTRTRVEKPCELPQDPNRNPLLDLPEAERAKLFVILRECPLMESVRFLLGDQNLPNATPAQINEFFREEAYQHWEVRTSRAADEADALVRLAEKCQPKFSAGILAALGQEAFRQVAKNEVDPEAMSRLATLFMKARSDERADQMQELKREKLQHELEEQVEHALEKLAEEVERHPAAKEAFEALRRELAEHAEEGE